MLKKSFVCIDNRKRLKKGVGCKRFAYREVDVYFVSYEVDVDDIQKFYLPHQCCKIMASYFVVNNKLDIGRHHGQRGDPQALCPNVRDSLWTKSMVFVGSRLMSFYLMDCDLY